MSEALTWGLGSGYMCMAGSTALHLYSESGRGGERRIGARHLEVPVTQLNHRGDRQYLPNQPVQLGSGQ